MQSSTWCWQLINLRLRLPCLSNICCSRITTPFFSSVDACRLGNRHKAKPTILQLKHSQLDFFWSHFLGRLDVRCLVVVCHQSANSTFHGIMMKCVNRSTPPPPIFASVAYLSSYHEKAINVQYELALEVVSHLSTTPRLGNPVKCLSQRHNK